MFWGYSVNEGEGVVSNSNEFTFKESRIEGWIVPTIEFSEPAPARPPLCVAVSKVIINSNTAGTRQHEWKAKIASAIKDKRGEQPWRKRDEYAISLAMRFHLGSHRNQKLDADNFVKPILDAVAAGLFCCNCTEPYSITNWKYDDSNFKTLLIHRLPDAETRCDEGIAVCVSVKSGTAADVP